jgi:hypothetical protein
MKKILLSMMVLCCALAGKAQATTDVPKAVLQHGDQVSVFQGPNAFVQAMTAAADGDVITLSDGNFVPAPINKSVSIYGAGYVKNAETGTTQSCLNGNVFIGVQGDTLCNVHLEGVLITNGALYAGFVNNNSTKVPLKNLTIEKCWMSQAMQMGSYNENLTLKQCVLANGLSRGLCKNTLITNCLLYGQISGYTEDYEILVDHSICSGNHYTGDSGRGILWTNCIFTYTSNSYNMSGGNCVAKNCLKWSSAWFGGGTTTENIYNFEDISQVFVDAENANWAANRTFELKQPDVWIGTDGTPVGPSGGMGWSTVPRVPYIKSLELNVEGPQLRINYEAEAR